MGESWPNDALDAAIDTFVANCGKLMATYVREGPRRPEFPNFGLCPTQKVDTRYGPAVCAVEKRRACVLFYKTSQNGTAGTVLADNANVETCKDTHLCSAVQLVIMDACSQHATIENNALFYCTMRQMEDEHWMPCTAPKKVELEHWYAFKHLFNHSIL